MGLPVAQVPSPPPPTPVPPFGSPSPFPSTLVTPPPSVAPPTIDAASAILVDQETGQVLFEMRADDRLPIASLTKVMTALVVLEHVDDLATPVIVSAHAASQIGSGLGLVSGERVAVGDLLSALLLGSANDAAVALAEHVAESEEAFAGLMDHRAAAMGLTGTDLEDPSGLDNDGHSTARDVATMFRSSMREATFAAITATRSVDIDAPGGPDRHVQNRNVLLWLYPGATGGKTGFTTPAGHCLVAAASRLGRGVVAVVLGSTEPAFDDAASLLDHGLGSFVPVTVVAEGQGLGGFAVEGRQVAAVARGSLARLIRVDRLARTELRLVPQPGLVLPVTVGQTVGEVWAFDGDVLVGVVPAVAALDVLPGPPPGAIGDLFATLVGAVGDGFL